jgi:hypothetical protein
LLLWKIRINPGERINKSLIINTNPFGLVLSLLREKHPQSKFMPRSIFIEMININKKSNDDSIMAELLMKNPRSRNKPQKNSIQGKILAVE